jgi:hypothetical protein
MAYRSRFRNLAAENGLSHEGPVPEPPGGDSYVRRFTQKTVALPGELRA